MGHQEYKHYKLGERHELTDLVPIVRQPAQQHLFQDDIQLGEQSIPVNKPEKFEVEDISMLEGK